MKVVDGLPLTIFSRSSILDVWLGSKFTSVSRTMCFRNLWWATLFGTFEYLKQNWGKKYLERSSRPEVFCKKGVLKNVAKFTRKHLCQSLFFNKVAGLSKKSSWNFELSLELLFFSLEESKSIEYLSSCVSSFPSIFNFKSKESLNEELKK